MHAGSMPALCQEQPQGSEEQKELRLEAYPAETSVHLPPESFLQTGRSDYRIGRQDLLDLEKQMSEYGEQFLKQQPGNPTATGRALDSAEATSPLQDATQRFVDAMQTALNFTAILLGADSGQGGTVQISTDFGPENADANDMNTLRETRKMRDLSRQTYLEELQRRGLLDDEFDFEEEERRLEGEMMLLNAGGLGDIDEVEGDEDDEDEDEGEGEDT